MDHQGTVSISRFSRIEVSRTPSFLVLVLIFIYPHLHDSFACCPIQFTFVKETQDVIVIIAEVRQSKASGGFSGADRSLSAS